MNSLSKIKTIILTFINNHRQSKFLGLNIYDIFKGVILAIIMNISGFIITYVNANNYNFLNWDWKTILSMSIVTAISYFIKNVFSNSSGQPFIPE